jgi:hypothetical protein
MILYGKAHWIFESDEVPNFPPGPGGEPIVIVDITDKPDVQEGWLYDRDTGTFSPPPPPEPEEPEESEEPAE